MQAIRTILLCLCLSLSFCAPVLAESVMFDAHDPPFMYDVDGQAMGVYPAILAEAFKRMGIPLEMQAVPWKRALSAIDHGQSGVGGIYKSDERLKKYDYSDKLLDEVIQVYVLRGMESEFTSVSSLTGKTIGVLSGWSYGEDFDAAARSGKIIVEAVAGDTQNFFKLMRGHVDAVLAVSEVGDMIMAGSPDIAKAIVALPIPLSNFPTFLAFNKSANKTEVLAKFNSAIAQMKADGSMNKLVEAIFPVK